MQFLGSLQGCPHLTVSRSHLHLNELLSSQSAWSESRQRCTRAPELPGAFGGADSAPRRGGLLQQLQHLVKAPSAPAEDMHKHRVTGSYQSPLKLITQPRPALNYSLEGLDPSGVSHRVLQP